jgi:hypothetical protein
MGACALAAAVFGVSEAWGSKGSKSQVAVTVDPSYFDRKIQRLAILDVIKPTVTDDRVDVIMDLFQAEIQDQGEFFLLFMDDLKAAAQRAGVKTEYETLVRVWRSRHEIEGPALDKVAQATNIDALICATITHFEQFKLEYTQEGHSTTTVGLKVQMFDAKDKKTLWEASEVKVAKSPPYQPEGYVSSDAGGVTRQGMRGVPEPPEVELVCEQVVKDVVGTFPKEEEKDEKKTDKKKTKEKDEKSEKKESEGR